MLCRRSSLRFLASLFSAFAKHRFSKPLRYLTKLVLAKPFHRKSRHFFSLPCQCIRSKTLPQRIVTVHHFSFANHISAVLCHCFAALGPSSLFLRLACLCFSVPPRCFAQSRLDAPCYRCSSLFIAVPSLCHASRCHCTAVHLSATPSHLHESLRISISLDFFATRCLCRSVQSGLCRCASSQITAMPLQCKSPLRCAQPSHGQSNLSLAFA